MGFTKRPTRGHGGTFYFLEESKSRVVEFRAIAVEVLALSRERPCEKGEETGAELLAELGFCTA